MFSLSISLSLSHSLNPISFPRKHFSPFYRLSTELELNVRTNSRDSVFLWMGDDENTSSDDYLGIGTDNGLVKVCIHVFMCVSKNLLIYLAYLITIFQFELRIEHCKCANKIVSFGFWSLILECLLRIESFVFKSFGSASIKKYKFCNCFKANLSIFQVVWNLGWFSRGEITVPDLNITDGEWHNIHIKR